MASSANKDQLSDSAGIDLALIRRREICGIGRAPRRDLPSRTADPSSRAMKRTQYRGCERSKGVYPKHEESGHEAP